MLQAIDSYFLHVEQRMATVNPSRKLVGISDGADWPPKTIVFEALYLLTLGQKASGRAFWSATVPVYTHTLQWTWIIGGDDLQAGKVGRSRGDKYRTNLTMREELLRASWPWWAEKKSWAVLGTTPSGLALSGTSLSPKENIWWTRPEFMNKIDRESGVIYGIATIYLTDMDAEITS